MESESKDMTWRILKTLEDISGKLDKLIDLTELGLSSQFLAIKERVLSGSELRREIYELCDGERTVRNIADVLQKSISHVSQELATLQEARLVKAKRIGKEKYYQKII